MKLKGVGIYEQRTKRHRDIETYRYTGTYEYMDTGT